MIQIQRLEKNFPDGFSLKIPELHIQKGERVAIIGPNGSGKSTLLRLIAGIIAPGGGEITIADKKALGYQPQNAYCFKTTVEKNIRLAAKTDADIQGILKNTLLYDLKDKRSTELSGGEKQRMCLARMLAGNYGILLLDEPLSAADIEASKIMEDYLMSECEKRQITLLMCTHLPSQALHIATKVLIMNAGLVTEYSDAGKLTNPQSDFGKKFIEQWRI